MPEITHASVIDSRDIIERIAELEADEDRTEEETEELESLTAFAEEASQYADDWEYGEALISDDYFEDYAKELAEDCCGPIPNTWPHRCIDWAQAAEELKEDYTALVWSGETYWIR